MHEIERSRQTPRAIYAKKCEACSMKPVCLPTATQSASAIAYLRRAAAANLRQTSDPQPTEGVEDPSL
jgi:hypothetical protein